MNDARAAKDAFDHGEWLKSQKIYETMLPKAPGNVYILSNLGVVYFRNQKWKLAEASLKKAISVDPKDAFSHYTLGIVYYQEKRYDDAINSLACALAINPKYSEAQAWMNMIRQEAASPVGDFETEHERLIRQAPETSAAL